jgi:thiol-disulfide isomerase/thioredoxin
MSTIEVGESAPLVPSVTFEEGPVLLAFYKVTCPVCQMAAPKIDAIERAYPRRVVGVGQDPPEDLAMFGRTYGMGIRSVADLAPYDVSNAYGIEVVPTLALVDPSGKVVDRVLSWDRDGYNRIAAGLAELIEADPVTVSDKGDGLPAFRPG